jgi:hypothetical protein
VAVKTWDVFISHASEDKEAVALPLADALKRAGLKVWLDRQELRLGDSLREKIDQGLAESRFGVVVLSQHFLQKRWPNRELNGLSALEEDGKKVILPVWHEITKTELASYSPMLADRLAVSTSDGIDKTARAILDVVLSPGSGSPSLLSPTRARCLNALLDRKAAVDEIVGFLSAHPAIVKHSIPMTPMLDDLVLTDVVFEQALVPFVVVCGTMARTYPGAILVGFSSCYGPLMEDGQLARDIADRVTSMREALDHFKADPLAAIQPDWQTRRSDGSSETYAAVWRNAFTGAAIRTRDELRRGRFDDKRVVLVEGVLFARRRLERSDTERACLSQMAGDITVRSYDRLLEQAMEVDERSTRANLIRYPHTC